MSRSEKYGNYDMGRSDRTRVSLPFKRNYKDLIIYFQFLIKLLVGTFIFDKVITFDIIILLVYSVKATRSKHVGYYIFSLFLLFEVKLL